MASPAKAVPPPTRIAGTLGIGAVPSLSRAAALPNRTVAILPPMARNAVVRIPHDRSERVLVRAHRAGGVEDQQRVRFLQRRGDRARDRPRVRAGAASACALEAPARVGA